jgi:hypothetical protein
VGTLDVSRGGTGVTTFGGNNTLLFTTSANVLSSIATSNDSMLVTNGSGVPSLSTTVPTALQNTISHANLTNLTTGDPHTQYAFLAGRAGGQTLYGGNASGNDLVLGSTSDLSKGTVNLLDQTLVNKIDSLTPLSVMLIGTDPLASGGVEMGTTGTVTKVNGDLHIEQDLEGYSSGKVRVAPNASIVGTGVDLGWVSTGSEVRSLGPFHASPGAGYGMDSTAPGGMLPIGAIHATSIQLARVGAPTTVLDILNVTQGTGKGIDTTGAGILAIGQTQATSINLYKPVLVQGSVDTLTGTALTVGGTVATSVSVAQSGVNTNVNGPLRVQSIIDTQTATALNIGGTNATGVNLGTASTLVHVLGDLLVSGTTTTVDSEVVSIKDNYINLSSGYTTVSARAGGTTVNYLPTATTTTVAAGGFDSTTTVFSTANVFVNNDIIEISGANDTDNNGMFIVQSNAGGVLTIKSVVDASVGFARTAFAVDATVAGTITKINVSVMRAGTSGDWEVGKGAVSPLVYSSLATTSSRFSFTLVTNQVNVNGTSYSSVGFLPWNATTLAGITTGTFSAFVITGASRTADIQLWNATASLALATITVPVSTTGVVSAAIANIPVAGSRIEVRVRKNAGGGSNPQMYGATLTLST